VRVQFGFQPFHGKKKTVQNLIIYLGTWLNLYNTWVSINDQVELVVATRRMKVLSTADRYYYNELILSIARVLESINELQFYTLVNYEEKKLYRVAWPNYHYARKLSQLVQPDHHNINNNNNIILLCSERH